MDPDGVDDKDEDVDIELDDPNVGSNNELNEQINSDSESESNEEVLSTENAQRPPIKEFKRGMSKSTLKDALRTSFVTQWIKQELMWPKNMKGTQRALLPFERATIEMARSLYAKPSTLLVKDPQSKL
jgi:hypothetical protein